MSTRAESTGTKVFLSYGQRDAAALAARLREDLERAGYRVWQDAERIRAGRGWTEEVRAGVRESDVLVALMSPHSVRQVGAPGNPDDRDSVCLNEIAYAVDACRIPVVPVMALACEPPFRIFHLQYLDFRDWRESEARYRELLGRLRASLDESAARRRSPARAWDWLPEPWDFSAFLADKRRDFTGREWLFREIEEWRARGPEAALLVTGDPGAGKSAIVAELVHTNPGGQVLAYHCCHADTPATLDPARFVRSLAAMLAARLEGYAGMLEHPPLRAALGEAAVAEDPASAFEVGILGPLNRLPAPAEGVRYLLIDALDEAAARAAAPTIIDLLVTRLRRFPAWLKVVATTRGEPAVLRRLSGLKSRHISAESEENRKDVRRYVARRLAGPRLSAAVGASGRGVGALTEMLLGASGGNFLFVTAALEAIAAGQMTFARVEALPPGLGGLYYEFFERLYGRGGADFGPARAVLETVVAAREPPARAGLAAATGLDEEAELPPILARLSSFVPARGGRYVLFHKSLRDWLTGWDEAADQPVAQGYHVNPRPGHEGWAALYWRRYEAGGRLSDVPARRHLPAHLAGARRWDDLARLLLDWRFMEAKAEGPGTNVFDLLADFALAAELLPADHARRRTLALVGEAVRLDAQFVARHPSTLFQCCWNRCWWHDAPRAASFFTLAEGSKDAAPPWEQPGEKLYEFAERWRAEKERETPGFLWLRALRPLPEILGSAQRAVLHGHDDNLKCVDVSPDGSRVVSGSSGPGGVVKLWDARSGAELVTKDCAGWGGVEGLRYLPEGGAVVAACRRGALLFLDAETLEELDCVTAGREGLVSLAVSPDGSRLAVGGWEGSVYLWDARERKRLSAVRRHEGQVHALAFSPDGSLLTSKDDLAMELGPPGEGNTLRVGHFIRLWKVGAKLTLAASYKHTTGVGDVTFSPDGQALVWCDGAGRIVFRRLADGSEWGLDEESWEPLGTLLFLPDGRRLLCGENAEVGDASIVLWDVERRRVECRFDGHVLGVKDMALFPGGRAFISAGGATLRVWELERTAKVRHAEPEVDHLLFVPGRPLVVTAGLESETVWVRSLADDGATMKLEGHELGVSSMTLSADGSLLACGTRFGQVFVWELGTGESCWFHQQPTEDGIDEILGVIFSPDGHLLAACDAGTILVFEAESGAEVAAYGRPDFFPASLAFSPDGRRLAAAGSDSIVIRDLKRKKARITRFPLDERINCRAICFTPGGEAIVVEGWDGRLTAWDSRSGARLELDDEHRAAFDRFNNRLVKAWVWETGGGEEAERAGAPPQQMMTLVSGATGEAVAWLPLLRDEVFHHRGGRIWANRRGSQVWMVALEGAAF